ncbi:MAG: hypothetical protein ACE5PT_04110, partial [Gemmatimonadales bacterium]
TGTVDVSSPLTADPADVPATAPVFVAGASVSLRGSGPRAVTGPEQMAGRDEAEGIGSAAKRELRQALRAERRAATDAEREARRGPEPPTSKPAREKRRRPTRH